MNRRWLELFLIFIFGLLVLSPALIAWQRHPVAGTIDLAEYWAAARLFVSGRNPYDPELMAQIQSAQFPGREIILMWNPPSVFAVIFPLGMLEFVHARALWLAATLLGFFFSLVILLKALGINANMRPEARILTALFIVTFYPLMSCMWFGQISYILLIGLTLFLYCEFLHCENPQSGRLRVFGSALGLFLTTIKPHLLYLLYLNLFVEALKGKRISTAAAVVGIFIMLGMVLLAVSPEIFSWYYQMLGSPPIHFKNPNLGAWLQDVTQIHESWIRLLPSVVCVAAYLALRLLLSFNWSTADAVYLLLPLSLVSAPYGWIYDFLLLLPVGLWIIMRACQTRRRWVVLILIALNVSIVPAPGTSIGFGIHELYYPLGYAVLVMLLLLQQGAAPKTSMP